MYLVPCWPTGAPPTLPLPIFDGNWIRMGMEKGLETRSPDPSGKRDWDTWPGEPPRLAEGTLEWLAEEASLRIWQQPPDELQSIPPAFPVRLPGKKPNRILELVLPR